jgi:glycosyltransferase involved in cell wall biosynthesis
MSFNGRAMNDATGRRGIPQADDASATAVAPQGLDHRTAGAESICPVVLTFNEELNLARVLERLGWARKIIVVDSFSTDTTEVIARRYPNVEFHQRRFDSHAAQWNAALALVPSDYEWVLALDADYVLSPALVDEIATGGFDHAADAFFVRFSYVFGGRVLRCGIYPPVAILFRRGSATYRQDGHTQRLNVVGLRLGWLYGVVFHDDRKSIRQWLSAQASYALWETELPDSHGLLRRLLRRVPPLAGLASFVYVYVCRLGFLDGRAGLSYASQRACAESMIAMSRLCRSLESEINR